MMDSSAVWHNQDPTLAGPPQDDFQQFLDMGINNMDESLHFDFQDFTHQQQPPGEDTPMRDHVPTSGTSHPAVSGPPIARTLNSSHVPNESLSDLDAQIQYLQHQRQQQQQRQLQEQQRNFYAQNRMIPPTPNSMEIHGNNPQFYPQSDPQQQAMYDRYRMQVKEQEMAFTPLVSPAVTPLETHFSVPEYTVPGAYFSPLSSPALHAQNEQPSKYDQQNSGATNSPIDMNLDNQPTPGSGSILSRKPTRKAAPQKPRSTRGVRQSPIVKPRKDRRSTTISAQALGEILEPSESTTTRKENSSSHSTASTEVSENGSVSPEHLSGMAPPPVPPPGSSGRSPYIQAQNTARTGRLALGSPATPASLMRLTQSPNVAQPLSKQDADVDHGMEGFSLPEAANAPRPSLSQIDTQSDGQVTPTLGSAGVKTPNFPPLQSPVNARPRLSNSASQSPQIDPVNGANRKQPSANARNKKRTSSSVMASPALLPRISPSIKPLLPGGGSVSEDTASLLLASKSNYQNILEGTHLPGVSYPTELSTNLTSKRTSHKIAEQGRRNRINHALQEIATLLPRAGGKDSGGERSGSGEVGDTEHGGNKGGGQSANSKASTVELAIEYIKQLKSDLADATKRAEEAEKQLSGAKS